ncbi:hypothetical protein HCEG_05027 [Histoplasma capsulatum var. duboisii H88]|uniref:Uncharacterized protein n=1 Tax=Ajellomyces capsulatus (strain H88) TaxID=544711 RepID=F0UJR9_AJEC8|nr:hypothetical protein HCEG_05027 [Histoplasma capsulatum var. duboisii H88]
MVSSSGKTAQLGYRATSDWAVVQLLCCHHPTQPHWLPLRGSNGNLITAIAYLGNLQGTESMISGDMTLLAVLLP